MFAPVASAARPTACPAAPSPVLDAITALRDAAGDVVGCATRPLTDAQADALATIYRNYSAMLLTVARRFVGQEGDADDVVHDVFIRLPSAIARYGGGGFGGWLKQVTVRAALMRLRSARSRREDALAESDGGGRREDWRAATGESAVIDREDDSEMRRALLALPETLREVVVLRVYLEYSHQEIADALDISVTASEVRFCRAVKRLRLTLAAGGHRMRPSRAAEERTTARRAS